jgi:hypothetical protein
MSQLRVFGLVIFTLITVVACGGQNGSAELTDNQKNLVAERLAPHGSVVMAGQACSFSSGLCCRSYRVNLSTLATAKLVIIMA